MYISILFWLRGERGTGKMWPWGRLGNSSRKCGFGKISEGSRGGSRGGLGGFPGGSRVVLGRFSGGSRVVLGWFSGWYSRTKHIQSQEIIMPEASTKKRVWKQGPILHEMMFRLHETTVSTSASKLSKITKWVSKAGLLGSFLH